MIHFSYIHVPSNRNLEAFTSKSVQYLNQYSCLNRVDVTFKKIFDFKNRTREVAHFAITCDGYQVHCEIASLNFKKSVVIAVKSLGSKLMANRDQLSA
ncbi:hypothetical protein F0365_13110 [Nonlabens sp. Ci31]|jgi:hypothetical protein|uniref:hypothetical protein n=1 Tax=Nonlabens sp. Ci31 TaxID=2608253 RepID=UPI001462F56B|nr:hypothetical protein [Nonlabens sp. Ci31]QJP35264.1 hypothetical protein F0365_13110 [Nonlabens sp. Ci31]